jgi:stage II sporulation protein D
VQSQSVTRRLTRSGLASIALAVALVGAPAGASASTLVINGAGDGHGVGMSQDGALGYAEHGWSYRAILAHYYQHTSIGAAPRGTIVKVLAGKRVKRLALEIYLRGVVAAEVSASWPMAALEAQAVASRTYALTAHAGGSRFDVYSDTRSQVYLGKAAETPSTNAAVAATAGQIVTYAGEPAITYFYADSGGHTESVQYGFPGSTPEPWLVGVADPYDAGPLSKWTVSMSFAAAASRLRGLVHGTFQGIEVTRRGNSPRIVAAYVLGSRGRTGLSGVELAARLGLYDTWAYFGVRDGRGLHAEPDLSGRAPAAEPPSQTGSPGALSGTGGVASATGQPAASTIGGAGGVAAG